MKILDNRVSGFMPTKFRITPGNNTFLVGGEELQIPPAEYTRAEIDKMVSQFQREILERGKAKLTISDNEAP